MTKIYYREPEKSDADKLDNILVTRCTEAEKIELKTSANSLNISASELMRRRLFADRTTK